MKSAHQMGGASTKRAATESEQAELAELRRRYIPRGITTAHPLVVDHAQGAELWDIAGRRYIDFAGGIGVLNVGHGHPHVMEAVRAQLDRVTHTSFQVVMYESYLRLAERLCALAPGDGPKKAIFFSTGAEAVENAVKIARAHTGRPAVISFQGGFHGRTLLALSLTGSVVPYKQNFGPYAPEVYQVPFPYEYRGWSTEKALASLDELFESAVAPQRVAAIIIEPVLGEGGFVPAPAAFMHELRALTERHGILLIADEIQSGFCRTGDWFACEHEDVVPDLITMAKGIAGGLPLAAVTGRADVMDSVHGGGLGGTYGGNPVACAAALGAIETMENEDLCGRAREIEALFMPRLGDLAEKFAVIGDVRGRGAMLAIELVDGGGDKAPNPALTGAVNAYCHSQGVVTLTAGTFGNVLRFLPPLSAGDDLLNEGLDVLEQAFVLNA